MKIPERSEAWWLAKADAEGDCDVSAGASGSHPSFAETLSAVSFARSLIADETRARHAPAGLLARELAALLVALAAAQARATQAEAALARMTPTEGPCPTR